MENIREKKRQELEKVAERPSEPVDVRDDTFNDFLKKYDVTVIDCWAPWCGPCRMMGPVIDALAKEMKGQAAFGKLNTDENPRTSLRFSVEAIPTILVFKEGELVDRHVGARPKDDLKRRLLARL